MATCSTSELMEAAECFLCLDARQMGAVTNALLCKILQGIDPMATCDVKSLMADAKCFFPLEPRQMAAVQLQLLCEILSAGSTSSGSGVTCGAVNPAVDPGTDCGLYYNTANATLWYWNNTLGTWLLLLG